MRDRAFRRYLDRLVGDRLLGSRRLPRRRSVTAAQAADLRTAIALRAAEPGSDRPAAEFQQALHDRLAAELDPAPTPAGITRRRLVQATSLAAASAVAGALVEHSAGSGIAADPDKPDLLMPNSGRWQTVAASTDLDGGTVRGFDLGTVNGFVQRKDGHLVAVSGVCTHLGCKLALTGDTAPELVCPCHRAAFATDGAVLRHQLPQQLRPLPRMAVREISGHIQVYAPE